MTLQQIKDAAAAYFSDNQARTSSDFTVNGVDLFLAAANQARRAALMSYDFEFTRLLAQVSVNGVSGGSLDGAVLYGTSAVVTIGTIVDVGLFDAAGNLIPVEWTTTGESLERQRKENAFGRELSTQADCLWTTDSPRLHGQRRVTLNGNTAYVWPKRADETFVLGIESYTQQADWTDVAGSATVTGTTGVTAINGTYGVQGTFNGRPLYFNTTTAGTTFALWWNTTAWLLTYAADLGNATPTNYASLTSTALLPSGTFTPHGTVTGTPVVAVASVSDVWTTIGQQYLLWASIVHLNNLFKSFVNRQEGNLPPPTAMMQQGLEALVLWDSNRFEQSRRHGR